MTRIHGYCDWLSDCCCTASLFICAFICVVCMRRRDDDDDSRSFIRPLLQLETVTSVLVYALVNSSVSDHDGTRMLDDSCVSVLEENSRWTVLPRRSCEDRIEASLWLEHQDHHVQPSVGDDDQRYQRPAGTW